MAIRAGDILTKEQRLEFTSLSDNISEEEIAVYHTLSSADIKIIKGSRQQKAENVC